MEETEEFTFSVKVKLEDANGVQIRIGSVLKNIKDEESGVVTKIIRDGVSRTPFDFNGDIHIQLTRGVTRCTNIYREWEHIPRSEQTYIQRLLSWSVQPFMFDGDTNELGISRDEALAIDGIMALLPEDIVDYGYGHFPDRLDDALQFLVEHLEELRKAGKNV